jgi:hypothetical protein
MARNGLVTCCLCVAVSCQSVKLSPYWRSVSWVVPQKMSYLLSSVMLEDFCTSLSLCNLVSFPSLGSWVVFLMCICLRGFIFHSLGFCPIEFLYHFCCLFTCNMLYGWFCGCIYVPLAFCTSYFYIFPFA